MLPDSALGQHSWRLLGTALTGHAAEGSWTAADVAAEAKRPGREEVPAGLPTGCLRGVPGLEGPTGACPELAFVTPSQTDTHSSLLCTSGREDRLCQDTLPLHNLCTPVTVCNATHNVVQTCASYCWQ